MLLTRYKCKVFHKTTFSSTYNHFFFIAPILFTTKPNKSQLVICRFLSGLGVGGSIPLIWAYCSEISPSNKKGFYMSILSTSWMVANVSISVLAYIVLPAQTAISSWRIFLALSTIPAVMVSERIF